MIGDFTRVFLVQPHAALGTNLVIVFHQQTDPEEREAKQQHQREDDPAATTNLARGEGWLVGAAVRASVLSARLVAHRRSS